MNNYDIGASITAAVIGAGTATAAGTGDASKVTGQTINRDGYNSGVVQIPWKAALTDTKTLSFAAEIQESSNGSDWDTPEEILAATVVKTATSSTTFYGVKEIDIDFAGRKKFCRVNITPDLSHSGTDTLVWGAAMVLGGATTIPV